MREVMDESDMATLREEQARDIAIHNALNQGAWNPMRGDAVCRKCGERNDRAHLGYGVCSACMDGDK